MDTSESPHKKKKRPGPNKKKRKNPGVIECDPKNSDERVSGRIYVTLKGNFVAYSEKEKNRQNICQDCASDGYIVRATKQKNKLCGQCATDTCELRHPCEHEFCSQEGKVEAKYKNREGEKLCVECAKYEGCWVPQWLIVKSSYKRFLAVRKHEERYEETKDYEEDHSLEAKYEHCNENYLADLVCCDTYGVDHGATFSQEEFDRLWEKTTNGKKKPYARATQWTEEGLVWEETGFKQWMMMCADQLVNMINAEVYPLLVYNQDCRGEPHLRYVRHNYKNPYIPLQWSKHPWDWRPLGKDALPGKFWDMFHEEMDNYDTDADADGKEYISKKVASNDRLAAESRIWDDWERTNLRHIRGKLRAVRKGLSDSIPAGHHIKPENLACTFHVELVRSRGVRTYHFTAPTERACNAWVMRLTAIINKFYRLAGYRWKVDCEGEWEESLGFTWFDNDGYHTNGYDTDHDDDVEKLPLGSGYTSLGTPHRNLFRPFHSLHTPGSRGRMVEDAMAELGRMMREKKRTSSRDTLACNKCFEIIRMKEFDALFESEREKFEEKLGGDSSCEEAD